jgi:hypothetical protein
MKYIDSIPLMNVEEKVDDEDNDSDDMENFFSLYKKRKATTIGLEMNLVNEEKKPKILKRV